MKKITTKKTISKKTAKKVVIKPVKPTAKKIAKKTIKKTVKKAAKKTSKKTIKKIDKKTLLKKLANLDLTVQETSKKNYILRLYITGSTPQSQLALSNIKRICEEHLQNRYELQVIDIYQSPALAKDEQIIAAPTLIKILPHPLRRLIGDLSNEDRVLLGLDVQKTKNKKTED